MRIGQIFQRKSVVFHWICFDFSSFVINGQPAAACVFPCRRAMFWLLVKGFLRIRPWFLPAGAWLCSAQVVETGARKTPNLNPFAFRPASLAFAGDFGQKSVFLRMFYVCHPLLFRE